MAAVNARIGAQKTLEKIRVTYAEKTGQLQSAEKKLARMMVTRDSLRPDQQVDFYDDMIHPIKQIIKELTRTLVDLDEEAAECEETLMAAQTKIGVLNQRTADTKKDEVEVESKKAVREMLAVAKMRQERQAKTQTQQ